MERRTSGTENGTRPRCTWGGSVIGFLIDVRAPDRSLATVFFRLSLVSVHHIAHDSEERHDVHRQGNMAIPTGPRAYFIVIQADFILADLERRLDGPARARNARELFQGSPHGSAGKEISELLRGGDATPNEQPAFVSRRRGWKRAIRPIVEPWPLATITGAQAYPSIFRPPLRQFTR